MLWWIDDIIERFESWWKNGNKLLELFVDNAEEEQYVGSMFGNQFSFLLMQIANSLSYLMTCYDKLKEMWIDHLTAVLWANRITVGFSTRY